MDTSKNGRGHATVHRGHGHGEENEKNDMIL